MAVHTLLSNFVSCYRTVFNKTIIAALQQPILTLKTESKQNLVVPEPPKKPLSSYFRYIFDRRLILKQQYPDWNSKDITKQCAEEWRNLDIEAKHPYEEAYHKDLGVYKNQKEQFTSSLTTDQAKALTLAKKAKITKKNKRILKKLWRDTDKPKRPISSFGFFIKEKKALPENQKTSLSDMLKIYSEQWNKFTSDEKQKYTQLYQQDKERYNKEIDEWEMKMVTEGKEAIIRKDNQVPSYKPQKLKSILDQSNHDDEWESKMMTHGKEAVMGKMNHVASSKAEKKGIAEKIKHDEKSKH